MKADRAVKLLNDRIDEGQAVAFTDVSAVDEWKMRAAQTLRAAMPDSELNTNLAEVKYSPTAWVGNRPVNMVDWRRRGVTDAVAVLRTAVFELEELSDAGPVDDSAYDADLWAHVHQLVETEQWEKVVSSAVIFLEDRLRKWSGRTNDDFAKGLVSKVLKPTGGDFPLGTTVPEREGWHSLALGIAGGVSNAARHRIDQRADAKRYAFGALGAVSLLLTQLRYEHEQDFKG